MNETELLRQEISDKTANLSSKIEVLETQAREVFSPVRQITDHPYLCLGLAIGAGFVVGSQINNKKLLQPLVLGVLNVVAGELGKKTFSA